MLVKRLVYFQQILENILFGLPYEEEWYRSVVYACALEKIIIIISLLLTLIVS